VRGSDQSIEILHASLLTAVQSIGWSGSHDKTATQDIAPFGVISLTE
jgi:hypothetical protein